VPLHRGFDSLIWPNRTIGVLRRRRLNQSKSLCRGTSAAAERSVPVTAIRLILVFTIVGLLAGEASAAPPSGAIPLPRPRPGIRTDATGKVAAHVAPGVAVTMLLAPSVSATSS